MAKRKNSSNKKSAKSFFQKVKQWYHQAPQWARRIINVFIFFFMLHIVLIGLYSFLPVPITPYMLLRVGEQMTDPDQKVRFKKDWASIDEISPNLQLAVIASEDQLFTDHFGFDFEAIEKAIAFNKNHKRKLGASTISQQTAKNLFLWPGRSWIRKILEVYFTSMLELCWSKQRIMTVYLNIIEFGDGIYGSEAASQFFFKKSAANLTRDQAALLAAVLPNPHKFSVANPSAHVNLRKQRILKQMRYYGKLNY
ncbi:MAG: monofunctional biosynthetic peptidoglycan transglycosylase [Saprospiraceae bacterium]|nr:monofunctional biosynthetic peptidoglycan transglycosylase [Saprospiraceae bacterium]